MRNALRGLAAIGLMLCTLTTTAAPVSFAALARHPQYNEVKISPDGRYLAASAVVHGQTVLALLRLSDHKGHLVKPRENDDLVDFWWASDDRVVYSVGERIGGFAPPLQTGELFGVDADGGNARLLFGFRKGIGDFASHLHQSGPEYANASMLATIDGDPDHVLITVDKWSSGGSAGALPQVDRLDVHDGRTTRITIAPAREAQFLADHHGHVRLASATDLQGHGHVYQYDGNQWHEIQAAGARHEWPVAFTADDRYAYFTCPADGEFGVCRWDPTSGRMTVVWHHADVEMDALALGSGAHHWMGVRFTDGRPGLSPFPGHDADVRIISALMRQYPGESVRFVSATRDGSKAVLLVQADADPGTYFLYDRARGKLAPLLQRAAWLDPTRLARKQPVTLKARDGLTLHGYLSYPPGHEHDRHLPMVVFVHGGPYGIRDRWDYDPYVQAMATRGYAVLQVNYRGSGGYGYDFEHAGWMQWGGRMQDDVTDATRWAIARGIADPARICIFGGSYGGYAALEGAVKEPDLYRCTIGYVGVYDLALMYRRGDIPQTVYGKHYLRDVLGTDPAQLAARSPIDHLDRLKARVMLVVGGRDPRVPPVQGERLHQALLQRHIQHVWLYKPDEMHGFYRRDNLAELFQRVDRFLRDSIGPGVGAAGASAH